VQLTGPHVVLRNASSADAPRLASIRAESEVERRWGVLEDGEMDEFVAEAKTFVVEVDGEVVGAAQYDEVEDPMYRSANIDLYLTTPRHGQGLGSEAVTVLARYLIEERGHHRLTIDPAADNAAAIRAYEKVGFRRVGVMRSYERGPDGTYHDGLQMELHSDDFLGQEPTRHVTEWSPILTDVTDDDRVFMALADPSRRFLLDRLFERDGRTITELESDLEMTRFGVMKHLRVLEDADLVVARRSGREKLHFLNPVPIRLIHDRWIDKYRERQASALADLKHELEEDTV
jgi:aminoglycoside 6'-N-acetyltransferase